MHSNTSDKPAQTALPCRGCTRDCSNWPRCGGKPWRLRVISEAKK